MNAEKLQEATINAEHLKAEEKKYWNNTIQGNIAQENASQKPHGKTSDPDLELRRFFNETFELKHIFVLYINIKILKYIK